MTSMDWLKWLGERRDGFLMSGAVLYGLGYLVWSYNAFRNHLGQIPALEFQYIIAGIVPAIAIILAWSAIMLFDTMRQKAAMLSGKYRGIISITLNIINIFILALWFDREFNIFGTSNIVPLNYYGPLGIIIPYLLLLIKTNPSSSFFDRLNRFLSPLLLACISVFVYVNFYPLLPQELGGSQPRCAYLDLVREEIAPSSLAVLAPESRVDIEKNVASKVIHSGRVDVYFSSSEYLLVRISNNGHVYSSRRLEEEPLYELRKEVIRVVQWCLD